jgi:hypothetical protein
MTPSPESAHSLVYVSWNELCLTSQKIWGSLKMHCGPIEANSKFRCLDRAGLPAHNLSDDLDRHLRSFSLVIILLSAKHSSPRWWNDEVNRLLIPAHRNGEITLLWQQIEKTSIVPPYLQQLTPLILFEDNEWKANKISDSTLQLSNIIKKKWDDIIKDKRDDAVSLSLARLQENQPQAVEIQNPCLKISHVALVISNPGDKEGRLTYDFALYHRRPTDTTYELLNQISDSRGAYPFPWTSSTVIEADKPSSPNQASPSCPVLDRLLEWAQRQNHRFVLEIFAPLALLKEPWGYLLVPLRGKREVLVKARPFVLRSWERLQPSFNSDSDYLKQKFHRITSGQPWTWMDECTFQPDNLSNHQSDPSHVAVHRATPLASQDQAHWLDAVVNSMVPLALWPHSPPPPSAPDPPTGTAPPDPHTTVLDQCLQALQTSPTHSSWPDLDRLAQLRFTARPAALRHYAILVDHPTRRPPPDVSSTDDLMISP